jgi:hypothetical protein
MIALIEPIFSEVLPFGDQVDQVAKSLPIPGGVGGPSQTAEAGTPSISRFNVRAQLHASYERLKRTFGITPRASSSSFRRSSSWSTCCARSRRSCRGTRSSTPDWE